MVGLSATLGGELGLGRYRDYFKDKAHYSFFLPETKEDFDVENLAWETWQRDQASGDWPVETLATLIQSKRAETMLPTVVLAESFPKAKEFARQMSREQESSLG